MARTQIIGSGFVTGEHRVTNDALGRLLNSSDEWVRERTGIEARYFVEKGTTTSDLGARAAERAIANAGIAKEEIDYVIFATMTPDFYFPGCGTLLQTKLGLGAIPALDIRQQCTGFIYGLQVADALTRSGLAKTILLVGAEIHSGFMPWNEWDYLFGRGDVGPAQEQISHYSRFRDRAVLFGDAAGAVILRRIEEEERGLIGFAIHSDGASAKDLCLPAVGFAFRPYVDQAQLDDNLTFPVMNGQAVFRAAMTRMPAVVRELCAARGLTIDDIDLLIAHQANLRINEGVQRTLGLSDSRVYNNVQRYGNTTAATIPIALHECRESGRIKPGALVCFVGLGAGLHWGCALWRA